MQEVGHLGVRVGGSCRGGWVMQGLGGSSWGGVCLCRVGWLMQV